MAILKGLTVTIESNGTSLQEYHDNDDQESSLNSTSKYVESRSGAAFAIRFFVLKIFSFTSDALGVSVYLDGTFIETGVLEGVLQEYMFKGASGPGEEGEFGYKEFTFNEIKVNDTSSTTKSPAVADLGSILVQVFRIRVMGPPVIGAARAYSSQGLRAKLTMSEKELKGRSVTHSAKLGDFKPSARRDFVRTKYVDGKKNPLAVFRFKYCSRRALQSLLLIPRTPSPPSTRSFAPVPLEERPFNTLTASQKDELARRQQARYRAELVENRTVKMECERGIKRERDVEYEEMMASTEVKRVKGPIGRGEVVEISDGE